MKNSFRIILAAALAALTIGGCNNPATPADTTAASVGNVTAAGTEAPETTTEEPFVPVVEGEPLPGIDSIQSNFGTSLLNQIMENEDGYYYNSISSETLSLHYYDKNTGKTIYLCAKPECLHDGNDFCTATTARYLPKSSALYGDKIYISAVDMVEFEKDNYVLKLIAANYDGTALSEITDVVKIQQDMRLATFTSPAGTHQSIVIHRGKALVPYSMGSAGAALHGYAIIDLATGNVDYREESEELHFSFFTAYGNAFYYRACVDKRSGVGFSANSLYDVWRYDINTKKSRKLNVYDSYLAFLGHDSSLPEESMFAVTDRKIYYCPGDMNGDSNGVMIYDMTTGETREFSELNDITFEKYDKDGELYYQTFYSGANDITYDGKYLYIAKGDGFSASHTSRDPECYVIDTDGKYYGKIEYDFDKYYGLYSMNFLNGNVYIQTSEKVVSASVDGLLNGSDDWHDVFTFEDVEYKNYG